MTPEQTLDWLAQQHFDQCREDRPVQHWIRKMKSELPVQRTWEGLTIEEYQEIIIKHDGGGLILFYHLIEARLREKNST
jgi:hypothetical protein